MPRRLYKNELRYILDNSKTVICDNGGGVANILLAQELRSKELIVIYPNDHIDDYYYNMASALDMNFIAINANKETEEKDIRMLITEYYYPCIDSDYTIDIDRLKMVIRSNKSVRV